VRSEATERLQRVQEEGRRLHEQADREIDDSMQAIRRLVEEFAGEMQNAPGTWSGKARSLVERVAELAAGTALAQRHLEFIASLRRGDSVYVIPSSATASWSACARSTRRLSFSWTANRSRSRSARSPSPTAPVSQ